MVDLAKLVVRLEAQSAQLLTELEKANRRIERFASATTKTLNKWSSGLVGIFSARALLNYSNQVLKAQDALGDMAQKVGISVETLSRLSFAAEQSGATIDGLQMGLLGLSKAAVAAQKNGGDAADAFEALGISVEDSSGKLKTNDRLLLEIADAFSQYEDGAAKSAIAQKILSKSGADLIPFLNKGAAGIEELTKKADALGATVSTKSAAAADAFNDSLAALAATTRGVVGTALGEVTPILTAYAEAALTGAENSEKMDKWARVLAAGLKILISAGVLVGEIFDRVGSTIGAAAAALVAVLQKDFLRAYEIVIQANKDHLTSAQETGAELAAVWTATGEEIAKAAEETDKKLKKTLSFGGNTDVVQEFKVGLQPMDIGAMEQLYKDLDQLTSTANEKALRAYYEQRAALDELSASQRISAEQYAARLEEVNKTLEDATGITERQNEALERQKQIMDEGKAVWEATRTPVEQYEQTLTRLNLLLQQGAIDQDTYARAVEDAQDKLDKANGKMTDFAEQARRNVQDILGQGLVDAMKGSSTDILQIFEDMITKLVAQALAADLAGKLFGTGEGGDNGWIGQALGMFGGGKGGGGGGTSSGVVAGENSWFENAIGAFGSWFGGSRDRGGRGRPGMAYEIGTGAQPEVYVPDQPGTFYPADMMNGSSTVNQTINVAGRPEMRTARQIAIESGRQQRIATARLG